MDTLTFISCLVASLVWPVAIVSLSLVFRRHFVQLLGSVRKLRLGDVEADFTKVIASAKSARAYRKITGHRVSPDNPNEGSMTLERFVTQELSAAERLIMVLCYYEALTDAQIADTLDLPENRVTQIRDATLRKLNEWCRSH